MQRADALHVLGLANEADHRQMKGRFRELARRHHPDKHAGDDKRQRLFGGSAKHTVH